MQNMRGIIDVRKAATELVKDTNSRILELGPLNRCLLDRAKFKNYFFADIRSTKEIKDLYSGNRYLEKTGLSVDLDSIINIDFVIKKSYQETFKNIEKFDFVIVSHVLEHIPNLLDFFLDIQNILRTDGKLIIIYPDRRFCFDHFRVDSKFSSIYDVWVKGKKDVASQVLDFYTNVVPENDAVKFWNVENDIKMNEKEEHEKNLKAYKNSLKGNLEEDIHYWPFSDSAFIKFLYDCMTYKLFSFAIEKFIPTQQNTQEFLVVVSFKNQSKRSVFEKNIKKAEEYFENEYYKIKDYKLQIRDLENKNTSLKDENAYTYSEIFDLQNQLVERSRMKYMIKNIFKKFWNYVIKLILYFPKKVFNKLENNKNEK